MSEQISSEQGSSEQGSSEQISSEQISERHASNLELFLDLVFVFSVTQVTSFVSSNLTREGVAKGMLLAFLVWWQWTGFTWAGTAVDLQSNRRARIVVLTMVPAMLVMAITVPRSLSDQSRWFASSYLVVQLLVLVIQALDAVKSEQTKRAYLRYAPLAAIAPTLLFVGSFFDGTARLVTWIAVALGMILSALRATEQEGSTWAIDATHFAERHALFIIITLGEVVVAIGATAASVAESRAFDESLLAAVVASVAVACVLWWAYFGFIPAVIELTLRESHDGTRGAIARDVGSFGHFPLVFGLILYAVVAKHVIAHPDEHLAVADRWVLVVAMVLFIGGQLLIQFRVVGRLSPERFAALAVIAVLAGLGGGLRGWVVVGLVAMTLAAMSVITARRFRASDLAALVHHSV